MKNLLALTIATAFLHVSATFAAEPIVLPLWNDVMPGPQPLVEGEEKDTTQADGRLVAGRPVVRLGNVSRPQVHVYLPKPEKANGGAVVVCPGGGFSILAWDLEGTEVAQWLNEIGYAALVTKYRVPTGGHGADADTVTHLPRKAVGPVMDAQRSISIARHNAKQWHLDTDRIGILGFSAGGETAAITALSGSNRLYLKRDEVDNKPCDPDFAILIYPGGLVNKEDGLLKKHLKVTSQSPPIFMTMAQDDRVGSENCVALASELKNADVAAELHLFPSGGHGYGLRPTLEPATTWPRLASQWLEGVNRDEYLAWNAQRKPIGSPADHLPPHIRQITKFGERAEFSHDSSKVLFLSKQFGDVMEYDLKTGQMQCLSQHFKHHGFNRCMYLSNGDILLTGPSQTFDSTDSKQRKEARHKAEMFVLDKSLASPPVALGIAATEGPAVSRNQLKIAWTHQAKGQERQTAISMGELVYEEGIPKLVNQTVLVTAADFPEGHRPKMIETQNFVAPDDRKITLTAYRLENGTNSEGYLLDLSSGELINFTQTLDHYEEVEGIFPDGQSSVVEKNTSDGKAWPLVDSWQVWFDGQQPPRRLTHFLDYQGYKASNQTVSDDGRLMAFQLGISGDEAGVGYGIFLLDLSELERINEQ